MLTHLLTAICVVLFAALISWTAINVITGCGEVTTDAFGAPIYGDCVLVPWASEGVAQ